MARATQVIESRVDARTIAELHIWAKRRGMECHSKSALVNSCLEVLRELAQSTPEFKVVEDPEEAMAYLMQEGLYRPGNAKRWSRGVRQFAASVAEYRSLEDVEVGGSKRVESSEQVAEAVRTFEQLQKEDAAELMAELGALTKDKIDPSAND